MAQSTALLDAIGKYQMYHTNYMEVTLFIFNCIERAKLGFAIIFSLCYVILT